MGTFLSPNRFGGKEDRITWLARVGNRNRWTGSSSGSSNGLQAGASSFASGSPSVRKQGSQIPPAGAGDPFALTSRIRYGCSSDSESYPALSVRTLVFE